MTNQDYINLKAFNLPTSQHFADVLNSMMSICKGNERDCSSLFCEVEHLLDKDFSKNFMVSFSDNDYRRNVENACEYFCEQYGGDKIYTLYERLNSISKDICSYIKDYIWQKSYADYIANKDIDICTDFIAMISSRNVFDYLKEIITVNSVEYLPNEITNEDREYWSEWHKKYDYIYKDTCWNNEHCFISIGNNSYKSVTIL